METSLVTSETAICASIFYSSDWPDFKDWENPALLRTRRKSYTHSPPAGVWTGSTSWLKLSVYKKFKCKTFNSQLHKAYGRGYPCTSLCGQNAHINVYNNRTCKQPECPSIKKWLNQLQHIHTREHHVQQLKRMRQISSPITDTMVNEESKYHNSTECELIYDFKNLCLCECKCMRERLCYLKCYDMYSYFTY